MCRVVFGAALVGLVVGVASPAAGEPYWIAWEGNDFPENEGWRRITGHGGAQRTVADGWLTIDGRADPRIYDVYRVEPVGALTVPPGHELVAQWRVEVTEVNVGPYDVGVGIFSDDKWAVGFDMSETKIASVFETGVFASYAPGVAHEFELRSRDMRAYTLFIDQRPALAGVFWESLTASRVSWGDMVQGASSLSRWDYMRFGIVPECNALAYVYAVVTVMSTFTRRRGR